MQHATLHMNHRCLILPIFQDVKFVMHSGIPEILKNSEHLMIIIRKSRRTIPQLDSKPISGTSVGGDFQNVTSIHTGRARPALKSHPEEVKSSDVKRPDEKRNQSGLESGLCGLWSLEWESLDSGLEWVCQGHRDPCLLTYINDLSTSSLVLRQEGFYFLQVTRNFRNWFFCV